MKAGQAVAALLCCSLAVAHAQFIVETNSMRVREPAALSGEFDVAIGDFGVPLYGATLLGEVVYASDNTQGCTRFSKNLQGKQGDLPVVALVHRGDCYFVEKAYNAEKAGAKAILIVDNVDESLLTMSNPEERPEIAKLKNDITIATALVQKGTGQKLVDELTKDNPASVIVELDWTESVDNPDDKVEWAMWTSSNDGCGRACDRQGAFKRQFQTTAVDLEKHGFTSFEPHFMHRKCDFPGQRSCDEECINHGRYCAFDSISDQYRSRFQPRQVVEENKRQLCIFKLARERQAPWLWWNFAAGYSERCTMAKGKFGDAGCAETETRAIGLDVHAVSSCMGDSNADAEHPLLQADLDAQGSQWDMQSPLHVLLLPTLSINSNQYRGRLDVLAVTRALCAGFSETSEPEVCLAGTIQTNDCADGNDGCWRDGPMTACVDTFRGRTCKCPPGYRGDGLACEDIDECAEHTSGCDQMCTNLKGGWECSCREGFTMFGGHSQPSLCLPKDMCSGKDNGGCEMGCVSKNGSAACTCPMVGLELNPADHRTCLNINECERDNGGCEQVCKDLDPRKTNLLFTCKCNSGYAIDPNNHSKCIKQEQFLARLGMGDAARRLTSSIGWGGVVGVVVLAAILTLAIGFGAYHFRMRYHAQQQIRDIMKQYMPLDGNGMDEEALLLKAQRIPAHTTSTEEPDVPRAPSNPA